MSSDDDWLVEPEQIRPGVLQARTLLPDRHRDIAVRVVNTTDEPQKLHKNLCVGDLTQVEQVGKESIVTSSNSNDEIIVKVKPLAGDECDPVAELIRALPPDLTNKQRIKAVELLKHP